ncbi:hypothetical protein BGZ70_010542 [Mortierella alpina]|uniref:Carrier domain-containing protein n=1 Tax=Mortierella alpina TaxID=64518 RepID=A0A9P6IZL4_MORAP|nr:hypothetical protein BGZ70_010542 [Mortierella alpina]
MPPTEPNGLLSGQHELDIALQGFASDRQIGTADASAYLSLHVDLSGDPTTVQLLEHVKRAVLVSAAHPPLRQKEPAVPHQVYFRWYDQGQGWSVVDFGQSSLSAVDPVGFELELYLQDVDGQIEGVMRYASALFDSTTIERHIGYLELMLRGMATDAMQSVTKIDILSSAEQSLLLYTWNRMPLVQREPQTIHQMFKEQVKRTPEAIALVNEDQELTYAELNARSNSLAHRLIELSIRPDTCVGICAGRSVAMVTGMLAILKAGGAYVPLDPTYPSERLKSILSDAATSIMVADEAGRAALDASLDEATLYSLTLVDPDTSLTHQTTNPQVHELTERSLAYVIYTSGEFCSIHEHSRTIQVASISFDVAVWEIFISISSGATLYLPPDSIRMDRDTLWDYMIQHSITHATFTPSFLQDGKDLPKSTKPLTLILGGEALSPTLLLNLIRQGITVFNDYGPTETSISAATWKCPMYFEGAVVPIGRPVRNARLYILDTDQQPVPLGTVGELYIGGEGVARGYLNRPEQTAERFLVDPFSDDKSAQMYRSGDLARYLPDGNLVYLGRNDDQVKIRGFRIELGEIEICLSEHEWVSEAVVLALGAGDNKRLVAYIVSEPHEQLPHHLRTHVAAKLPPYMVPEAYVRLDAMPLTANKKLDRKAMPAPDEDSFAREAYEHPRGDIEVKLATIWTQLLRTERISRHDSFFALGGHSLLAAKMLEHLRRAGLTVSVRSLFEYPTLSALARVVRVHEAISVPPNLITSESEVLTPEMLPLIVLNQSDIDNIVRNVPGGLSNIQDIYSLSPLQDGILFHHLLATEGDPYLITSTMAFESRALLDRYLDAFQTVVDRHDILRTAFFWENLSNSAQVVCRSAPLSIFELTLDPTDEPIEEHLDRLFNPRCYRIDLCQAPLLRFIIAKDANGRWLLVQLIHHSSAEKMHIEIKALLDGQGKSLPAPKPFRDLLAQARLKSNPKAHEQFFKDMLAGVDEPTLPFGLTTVIDGGAEVSESHQMLPQALNDRLRLQAKRLRVGLASVCHVAWAQVLARTSGQQRVVFGTVLFGRLQDEDSSGHALGLSINTLPIRCDIDKRSVRECVQDTHACLTALLEHEHASLALAQRCSDVPAGTPLFSGLLNYRHTTLSSSSCSDASETEFVSEEERVHYPGIGFVSGQERTNYPFCLSVEEFGAALGLTVQVLHPIDPSRVCAYMKQALEGIVEALETLNDAPIRHLEVLPSEERQMLLREWNTTQEAYPDHLCLHQLFEQQVERTPEAIAVVHEDQSLTYAELNARANSLAHQLIQLGVQPDALVAICVKRSPAMIIGVLAILKAGGAYVPLDPLYTSDRLRDILQDTSPVCLLADKTGRNALGKSALSTVTIMDPSIVEAHPTTNPQISTLTSRHLAYVIFTSGTTGKPKGVMIEHQGVVNLVTSRQEYMHVQSSSRITQFFSINFDASVCEIFGSLSFGGCLHLLQQELRLDRQRMWSYLQQHRITHATLTPTVLQDCEDLSLLSTMSKIVVAGEPLSAALVGKVHKLVPNGTIINEYGPTETTVAATLWKYSGDGFSDMAPIGRPLPNKRIYLLDIHGNPVPLGVIGEIYIGGVGVARGYLNRPDLTAERFLQDPFSEEAEGRMYKTGDLAQYLPDGNLVCLGRNDHQVKIRGFRIELGEIEARLTEHPLVSEAAIVCLGEESNKRLVAYVIVHSDHEAAQGMPKNMGK